jgi:hypothetical protein
MIQIIFRRGLSQIIACWGGGELRSGGACHGLRDKSAACRRAHVDGWIRVLGVTMNNPAGPPCRMRNQIKAPRAVGLADSLASSR